MKKEYKLLDHGHIKVVDYMGGDKAVVDSARISYQSGTQIKNNDVGLIRYLLRNHHVSVFESSVITFDIKLPIFVMRQYQRHKLVAINEVSARYSLMPNESYIPDEIHIQSKDNMQGREDELAEDNEKMRDAMKENFGRCYDLYESALDKNVARETARTVLPVGLYTNVILTTTLRDLIYFIKLRADEHAQYEIRVYAEALKDIMKDWAPATYQAAEDYVWQANQFSKHELSLLQYNGQPFPEEMLSLIHISEPTRPY